MYRLNAEISVTKHSTNFGESRIVFASSWRIFYGGFAAVLINRLRKNLPFHVAIFRNVSPTFNEDLLQHAAMVERVIGRY
jgi:hypothetical protein